MKGQNNYKNNFNYILFIDFKAYYFIIKIEELYEIV